MTIASPNWVELERVNLLAEANLIRATLESEGIPTMVPDEHSSAIMSHVMLNSTGGVRVWVQERDLEKARALLRDLAPVAHDPSHEPIPAKSAVQRFFQATMLSLLLPVLPIFAALYHLSRCKPQEVFSVKGILGLLMLVTGAALNAMLIWFVLRDMGIVRLPG